MSGELIEHGYNAQERGNRMRPTRSQRNYRSLIAILNGLQHIIDSKFVPPGENILDYGCGNKPYEQLFRRKFKHYVGADIAGNMHANLVIGADGHVPADNESFDCVLSSQVLEHVVSPEVYLREAYRLLKPDGSLILSTHGIWPYHPDPVDYWRWTIDGLQREIRRPGFEIVMVKGVFGPESSALQLWQDATFERLPRTVRPLYTWFIQTVIGLIERRQPDKLSNDASVYIVLGRKPIRSNVGACSSSAELNERQLDDLSANSIT